MAAGKVVKEEGLENDLLTRLANDPAVPFTNQELQALIGDGSQFVGRAPEQTDEFLAEVVMPRLAQYKDILGGVDSALSV